MHPIANVGLAGKVELTRHEIQTPGDHVVPATITGRV